MTKPKYLHQAAADMAIPIEKFFPFRKNKICASWQPDKVADPISRRLIIKRLYMCKIKTFWRVQQNSKLGF